MRFEIRTGGTLLILIGLMGLSGAVFALGMIAGYEMARQTQPDPSQLAAVYPLPPAPAESPSVDASPYALPSPEVAAVPSAAPSPPAADSAPTAAALPTIAARPALAVPEPSPAATAPSDDALELPSPSTTSAMARPPTATGAPKGKGFNIQIGGVMDSASANEIMGKLRALGYQPYTIEVMISGKKWYRVRVGPFPTEDQARAAQEQLKHQYRSAYAPP
jgi:cell division septation protein DedD